SPIEADSASRICGAIRARVHIAYTVFPQGSKSRYLPREPCNSMHLFKKKFYVYAWRSEFALTSAANSAFALWKNKQKWKNSAVLAFYPFSLLTSHAHRD